MTTHPIALNLQFGVARTAITPASRSTPDALLHQLLGLAERAPKGAKVEVHPLGESGLQLSVAQNGGYETYKFTPGFDPGTIEGDITIIRDGYRIETLVDAQSPDAIVGNIVTWADQVNHTQGALKHREWQPLLLPALVTPRAAAAAPETPAVK